MRLAILAPVTNPLPPQGYAPWEQVVHTLASGLFERGIDVTVFTCRESVTAYPLLKTIPKALNHEQEFKFQREMIHLSESLKIIGEGKFDLVNNHLHWNGLLGLNSINANFVTTLHGFEDYSRFVFEQYRDLPYISISFAEREDAPGLNYVGNAYNGVDFTAIKLQKRKEDYLLSNARMIGYKGIHLAIALAKKLKKRLYLAGLVHDQQYYDEMVKPQIDGEQIIYLGQIPHQKVLDLVSKAQAIISLISWKEPFGLAVAEAIACGTPVIATPMGSMKELVKEQVSGILVNSIAEAAARFSEIKSIDPKVCRDFGENLFSTTKMIDSYISIFNKLL